MRRFLFALALTAAPASAFACAMPHYEEKRLAELMKEVDAAQAQPVAVPSEAAPPSQAVPAATVVPQAPSNTAPPMVIPEATPKSKS
jgi:hypothetical protein